MSVLGAARHLGYKSRSQRYKLMNDGWLNEHVHVLSGQRLLDVEGLLFVTPVQAPVARRSNTSSLISYSEPVRSSDQGYGHQAEITPPRAGFFIA